ncbi:MAG: HNH endonuclease [Candidatus Margulisiibacteriota bacterium]
MDYTFERPRSDKIPREKILEELGRVAKLYNYLDFSYREFDKQANISADPARTQFGTWNKAKEALRKSLIKKGVELKPRRFRQRYTKKELFDEMERIWNRLGHRPSAREWEKADTRISSATYQERLGGWSNACLKFIEYKMGHAIHSNEEAPHAAIKNNTPQTQKAEKDKRTIPLGIRLEVLDRDSFRRKFCGRSPATDLGTRLHIDHIVPHSKGGKNTLGNLQTLCQECNLGKSNKENVGSEISRQRKT